MPLSITLPDESCRGLSEPAKDDLRTELHKYGLEIVSEAQRLESGQSQPGEVPDINRMMIQQSILYLKRRPRRRKKSNFIVGCTALSPILGFYAGILFDLSKMNEPTVLWHFLVVTFLFIATSIFSGVDFFSGDKNEI